MKRSGFDLTIIDGSAIRVHDVVFHSFAWSTMSFEVMLSRAVDNLAIDNIRPMHAKAAFGSKTTSVAAELVPDQS